MRGAARCTTTLTLVAFACANRSVRHTRAQFQIARGVFGLCPRRARDSVAASNSTCGVAAWRCLVGERGRPSDRTDAFRAQNNLRTCNRATCWRTERKMPRPRADLASARHILAGWNADFVMQGSFVPTTMRVHLEPHDTLPMFAQSVLLRFKNCMTTLRGQGAGIIFARAPSHPTRLWRHLVSN